MKSLLISGKVKPDVGGQVLDIYNKAVIQGISPTINTTIDKSNMTFVTIMNKEISYCSQRKEILHPNQEVHSKRLFPTDGSSRI